MEIKRLNNLVSKLRSKVAKSIQDDNVAVIVGFTAAYARRVHESPGTLKGKPRPNKRGKYWDPQGKAGPKFLEGPARELNNDGTFAWIMRQAYTATKTLAQGLLMCGLRLQREAQVRVPVNTGNLKASAFTRLIRRGQ